MFAAAAAKRNRPSPPPADDRDDPILGSFDMDAVEDVDSDSDDYDGPVGAIKLPRALRAEIARALGQGGYNCVYLTTQGDVLRLGKCARSAHFCIYVLAR